MQITTIADETRLALANLIDRTTGIAVPSLRLGVTGLARAGKTVFITALIHNLIHGGRLPVFKAYSSGRISGAALEPQPDDDVPRFDYEDHVRALVDERIWPESTRRISEIRLTIRYESASFLARTLGRGALHLDIVDYPGEWLLDLPLLSKDFATWSAEAVSLSKAAARAEFSAAWRARLQAIDPNAPEDEGTARELAGLFSAYLHAARAAGGSLSTVPPGRFLMPGDLDGSPALTFSPLDLGGRAIAPGSLAAMMARRYEAYKSAVVRPFFRDHFARLDRQIVLVDVLAALNAGSEAVAELERVCERPGMRTVMLGCWPHGDLAIAPEDDKLFGALAERGITLNIHVSMTQSMPAAHKAKLPGYGRFFDAPNRMIEMVFAGVFDRFP
ncbi:MAG TPA: YcjX family protein, partial [Bauldia sp.]|nr:YcjX family protein [Bauldia sp.]